MLSPEIISFDNGVIEWKAESNACSYVLKINDSSVSNSGADGLYNDNKYDLNGLSGVVKMEISPSGARENESKPTTVLYNSEKKKIYFPPISDFTVDGDILRWSAVSGATAYAVVDIEFNAVVVTDTYYDMSGKIAVYGVYPISACVGSDDIDELPPPIKYLDGSGTECDPYLIRTPFDLRAIDYYETRYEKNGGAKNHYRIENDLDYSSVFALEIESNLLTLSKPFYGVLDGNGKKLTHIRVNYDGGYWAMFDFITQGAEVKNMFFDSPEIYNRLQDNAMPLNPSIAMVANKNFGTVSGITLMQAEFSAAGGEVCGIVAHNYGKVSDCSVSGTLVQRNTAAIGYAGYEMSGVVLENCNGGRVDGNTVYSLTIRGAGNVRSAAGVVSVNRAGGTVSNNSFESIAVSGMIESSEYGGVTAYNAGLTVLGTGKLGTFTCGGVAVTENNGSTTDNRGMLIGKNGNT